MAMTRRGFLTAGGLATFASFAASAAGRAKAAAAAAAPALRPAGRGTSGRMCARCGSTEHTTLDQGCPGASETAAAVQSASRANAAGREAAS